MAMGFDNLAHVKTKLVADAMMLLYGEFGLAGLAEEEGILTPPSGCFANFRIETMKDEKDNQVTYGLVLKSSKPSGLSSHYGRHNSMLPMMMEGTTRNNQGCSL
ncbi:hypothetical protein QVD17_41424 [Tagetes erecta]|uniref:Uncharacterized protein n=1 Tax=Tagetes erecta TaxID=13708 RepID=A0AAD8JP95_TARER|nr:hypothetical protein QVD17_41424 [Tagetes erecta]